MAEKSGFPYFEVQFTKTGDVHDREEAEALQRHLATSDGEDLLVLAHGWNNDMRDARGLYDGLLRELRAAVSARRIAGAPRRITVLGVLWPSKKFADMEITASGAAGLGSAVTDDAILRQIDQLQEVFDEPEQVAALESAKALLPKLEDSPRAQREFADLVRSAVSHEPLPDDAREAADEDASDTFFALPGSDLMERLAKPIDLEAEFPADESGDEPFDDLGGAARVGVDDAGGAAGLGEFLSGMKAAAGNLLNYATFFSMKQRAGTVGQRGVNTLLREIAGQHPDLRVHLLGHSFGARLVTAATAGPDERAGFSPSSLVLLQAAFSHNGFAENFDGKGGNGDFRRIVARRLISGPIVVSHTRNDKAVGLAYPLASKISGSDSAGLGDARDRFGGLGSNGAQFTPEAVKGRLAPVSESYDFQRGRVYNLRADSVISSHSDIVKPEVAHVVLAAMAAS
ncbi:hypothetical protein ACFFGH_10075 [Lysobacter korlensis]|uniref:Serine-threonine protein kinase n=1 Tax=Lysobacter korlensis TaxID=553636 RepID=A0ABV6RMH2_9GAMM